MQKFSFTIVGVSPYCQCKAVAEPRKPKETADAHERRTWRQRLHVGDGRDAPEGQVFIPPMAVKKALEECAKYLSIQIPGKGKATYTKHFEAGVMIAKAIPVEDPKGPVMADDVQGKELFLPSDGRKGGGSRVQKILPHIYDWRGRVEGYILDDTITPEVFQQHLKGAGQFIGIGNWRPRNGGLNGRFIFEDLECMEVSEIEI